MKEVYSFIFISSLLFSCSGNSNQKAVEQKEAQVKKEFKMVDVPVLYATPENRAEFVALHYWDNFDFKDTSYVDLPDVTEQAWANYLQVLSMVPQRVSSKSIGHLIE